jgi:predicted permease
MIHRRAAARAYRMAVRMFPERHRRHYCVEMIDAFERELSSRRTRGGFAVLAFVAAACVDAIVTGFAERRRDRRWRLGVAWSGLDAVLAWRMIVRHPGLSVVGVCGISVGIAIAVTAFTIVGALTDPPLPLPKGERIVSLLNWDAATRNREPRLLYDYTWWRTMTTVEDIGIAHTVRRNLIAEGRPIELVTVAEISASAFRVARVEPLRGRVLRPEDEQTGSPDVIVIGRGEWMRRFGSDPNIVGRSVQLGSRTYAIVGVMPDGFAFPVRHSYWVPWRIDATAYVARSGPSVNVFGRLAPDATMERAQAEITTIGRRVAASVPDTHQHLLPRVVPYTYAFSDMDDPQNAVALYAIEVAIVLLLVIVCVNVAVLVYARTATRQGEIAVRDALGASRPRIVAQLFVEALILTGIAAAIGVGLAAVVLRQLDGSMLIVAGQVLPFWITLRLLSAASVVYIVALTLLAAGIVGVIPALAATRRDVQTRLRALSPGGGSHMQMGRVWTTLVIAQVAITVALLPASMFHAWTALRFRTGDPGFASGEYLTAQLVLDRNTAAPTVDGERGFSARFAAAHRELERRLQEEAVTDEVTFSMASVGEERAVVLEIEGRPSPPDGVRYNIIEGSTRGHLVRFNRVAIDFFDALDVPLLLGRGFRTSDVESGPQGVVVNRTAVETLFAGANPIGHRIRYVGRSREANERDVVLQRWYEIVGVVADIPKIGPMDAERVSRVYHAATFGDVYPVEMAMRVRNGAPLALAERLRAIGAAVDPDLQLRAVETADMALKREQGLMRLIGITVGLIILSVVVLSAACMYALMSFAVSQRRREIGIRAALGADRNRILTGIFAQTLARLGVGAGAGLLGALALEQVLEGEMLQGHDAVFVPLVVVLMTGVGLLAAVGPARRGLRIQPTEALRDH